MAGSRNRRVAEILFEQPGESRDFKKGETSEEESAAFIESSFGTYRESDVGGTVKRTGGALSGGSETLLVSKIGATLSTRWGVNSDQICNGNCIINYPKVRKLTPIECERLQGFPDNYTKIPWRNKTVEQCPDTQRYMVIGNSMAVPVMRWIGDRIK
ncbi:DNA cytosine methyltransferase [Neisseria sicca]|uniref:DNA cytosine methyltransferase n=1 Tax=Neisseria sicca TaxID=490 RepID=UPI002880BD11|nr:DNA cytosine methyltransferase [Neisseria sicca]